MAGIDRLYGSDNQYDELRQWLIDTWILTAKKPKTQETDRIRAIINGCLDSMFKRDGMESSDDRPIASFSAREDSWLYRNCPLQFVVDRINEQYSEDILYIILKKYEAKI